MDKSSQRIREIRRERDLSGTEVADKLGISAQYYYNIERGKRTLNAEIAVELSKIFKVPTDYLLGISDNKGNEVELVNEQKPYYSLTNKDERDIAKDLERIMANLDSDEGMSFYGEEAEFDDEAKELLRISLEQTMRMAKQMAKKKFTPKKYRNE